MNEASFFRSFDRNVLTVLVSAPKVVSDLLFVSQY
jgi:hypothetical protein